MMEAKLIMIVGNDNEIMKEFANERVSEMREKQKGFICVNYEAPSERRLAIMRTMLNRPEELPFIMSCVDVPYPETCLSNAGQMEMARTLIHFTRYGVSVVSISHSDTIMTHINSMVKLSQCEMEQQRAVMEKYGFDEMDMISKKQVEVWECVKGKAMRQDFADVYGFEIHCMNEDLGRLLDIARDTDPKEDDDE